MYTIIYIPLAPAEWHALPPGNWKLISRTADFEDKAGLGILAYFQWLS